MNTRNHTLRRLIELALLVMLILLVVFAIQTISITSRSNQESLSNEQADLSLTPAPEGPESGTPYVAPHQDLIMPTPVVTIFAAPKPTSIPWQVEGGNPYPEPRFAPTETPYPTPTQRPGPTETPLPLEEPTPDASGVIRYLVAGEAGTSLLVSQPVDALGQAKSAPEQQSLSVDIPPESDAHPSPDRRYLAVIRNMEVGFFGILIDVSSGEIIPFYPDIDQELFFNWFPDSKRILIRANSRSLWLVDPFTGEHITLAVPGYFNVRGAAASPDGNKIVYAYDFGVSSEPPQVRMINSDGRDDQLLFDALYGENFAWSPDGKKIAFLGNGWMVLNADGSDLRPLVDLRLPHCNIQPISWSPDSGSLAIVSSADFDGSCLDWSDKILERTDVYLVDVESGEAHPLLYDGIQGNIDPAWSPDGKQVAFVSIRSGSPEVWVVNVDGSNLHQLSSAGQPVRFPFWRSR